MLQGCRSDPLPFGRRKNPPTKIVAEISVCKFGGWKLSYETVSTTYTAIRRISDNSSHSIRSALFNRVNPDRVTICDAIRQADAFLFLNIWRIIVFSQQTENQHYFDYFEEAPYILTTVKPLPVWLMFIDRIIDRIWFLAVILTTELFQL